MTSRIKASLALITTLLGLIGFAIFMPASAQEGIAIPPPKANINPTKGPQVVVLAGGCFWGVQGVFQHTKGVISAVAGYAGGASQTANYGAVTTGTTGHAEAVKVTFDPAQISYGEILQIYFSVAHDPTQLNRQGPDRGTQYRSAIFPQNADQAKFAKAYIGELNTARVFNSAIVTKIETDKPFYPAESYHQDYMTNNPTQPYIVYNDLPKVEHLKKLFAKQYSAAPRLVAQTGI
ncbi:peptide-methionine (S)-S-oxide reductase MsrA (plasmid) [Bartonella sp. HY329]|uniref:peptide-methionine (S)-S-oxide reductase MsrA n=1 Tax=unclassified Bartonella TaxID=2645622 RepID=UPI0021C8441E|nr:MULTISPECIES: peptide-methionine (S)-S-oxide reductase MsrA [unclassified Bartonella]UXM96613.1 peptide-methionine (S)-S-oxide reductase MsrA [Bartonella sp. HY329]UXN10936.1 peptide-methionine (S)-S-oxide reductase MsrA [Bartonella sp. HY328]